MNRVAMQHFHVLRGFVALQILFSYSSLINGELIDFDPSVSILSDFCLNLKNYFLLLTRGLFFNFLHLVIITRLFWCCLNVVNVNFEIDNVDSTLLNVGAQNVVAMLIWRCPMSRHTINRTVTFKRFHGC